MISFTSRFSEPLIKPLDQLAAAHGLSRNAYLEYLAQEAVKRGFLPIKRGEGFEARSPSGALVSFVLDDPIVVSGQQSLAKSEQLTYVKARRLAEKGDWQAMKSLLVQSGFVVTALSAES